MCSTSLSPLLSLQGLHTRSCSSCLCFSPCHLVPSSGHSCCYLYLSLLLLSSHYFYFIFNISMLCSSFSCYVYLSCVCLFVYISSASQLTCVTLTTPPPQLALQNLMTISRHSGVSAIKSTASNLYLNPPSIGPFSIKFT